MSWIYKSDISKQAQASALKGAVLPSVAHIV